MKRYKSTLLYFAISLVFISCTPATTDPKPELTAAEKQVVLLSKTWIPGTVNYESANVTDRFNGFTLTLTQGKKFTTTLNRGDNDVEPFSPAGSWDFKDGNLNLIVRDDGVEMVVTVTENSLLLLFTFSDPNGRLNGLGEYRFDLIAQ